MIINTINNIYNTVLNPSRKTTRVNLFKPLEKDTFVKSFSSTDETQKDEKSFAEFEKWANESGFLENADEIIRDSAMFIGSGFEGKTYSLPDCPNWIIKEYNHGHFCNHPTEKIEIKEIKDISPKVNIGQPIAQLYIPINCNCSSMYWILKKQSGKEYGVAYPDASRLSPGNRLMHILSLRQLAAMPQSAFDKCIKDVDYITQEGYALDYSNPNNIMLDSENGSINFVDVNDKLVGGRKEQFAEALYSLLDSDFACNYNANAEDGDEKDEVNKLSYTIITKYFKAMKNNNKKFDINGYTILSDIINNYFGVKDKEAELKKFIEYGLI